VVVTVLAPPFGEKRWKENKWIEEKLSKNSIRGLGDKSE
jgi:hypothetical protein